MITRIHKLIDKEGISVRRFEQSINASNGLIRKAITNNTDVQSKWILEIAETYPNVNLDWLIKGEGDMYRESNNSGAKASAELIESQLLASREINELKLKIESLLTLIDSKNELIQAQSVTIQSKDQIIEVKNGIIASLQGK